VNWTKAVSQIVIIGIFGTILLAPHGMITNVDAAPKPPYDLGNNPPMVSRGDTLSDLQIRAVFHFTQGTSIVDSFHIFIQHPGGYDMTGQKSFQLTGGVTADKMMLYHVADNAHLLRHHDNAAAAFRDFDVDVMLMNNETTYRHFSYTDCNVDDYNITTLFDNEETFSRPDLKFVVADVFEFVCEDYHPHCPYCDEIMSATIKAEAESSMEYEDKQRSAWPDSWQAK
jgi:hypothetical protein